MADRKGEEATVNALEEALLEAEGRVLASEEAIRDAFKAQEAAQAELKMKSEGLEAVTKNAKGCLSFRHAEDKEGDRQKESDERKRALLNQFLSMLIKARIGLGGPAAVGSKIWRRVDLQPNEENKFQLEVWTLEEVASYAVKQNRAGKWSWGMICKSDLADAQSRRQLSRIKQYGMCSELPLTAEGVKCGFGWCPILGSGENGLFSAEKDKDKEKEAIEMTRKIIRAVRAIQNPSEPICFV